MSNIVKVPYKQKMLNANGTLTNVWAKFFRDLFLLNSGTTTTSNSSANVITNADDIADLKLRIEALEQEPVE